MVKSWYIANLLSARDAKSSTQVFSNCILHRHRQLKNIVSKRSSFQCVVSPRNVSTVMLWYTALYNEKTVLTVMLPALNAISILKLAAVSRKQGRKQTCTGPPIIVSSSQMFTLGTIPEKWWYHQTKTYQFILAMCWVHPVIKKDVSHCHRSTAQQTLLLDAGLHTIDESNSS